MATQTQSKKRLTEAEKVINKIQTAINDVRIPENLTPAKQEYAKAGARLVINAVNRALLK